MNTPILCYVDSPWAYFTTQNIYDQWGDDWDDAPYEHNAGRPYQYGEHDKNEGREPWVILKVAWDGDFEAPCDGYNNSPWSVQKINAGEIPWLTTNQWRKEKPVEIWAGTTLERFIELIEDGGGMVYTAERKP